VIPRCLVPPAPGDHLCIDRYTGRSQEKGTILSTPDCPTPEEVEVAGLRVELLQESNLVLIRLYSLDENERRWAADYLASAEWDERILLDVLAALAEQHDAP
jgi:hypothetical protein